MKQEPIKIAVVGAGHLGHFHLNCLSQSDKFIVQGLYDVNPDRAHEMSETHGVKAYSDLSQLIEEVEAVDVVTPTSTHAAIAAEAITAGKHVFIEKPITSTVEEAMNLSRLQKKYQVRVQIGHVERFNPAILALQGQTLTPLFIEGHRLAQFNPRGTDVSVVLDLMIHDLDLILKLVNSEVTDIHTKRVAVVSSADDICNTRLAFANGCVVNLTASRISMKNMRKLRVFQEDAYISIDMLAKETQIIRLDPATPDDPSDELIDTIRGQRKIVMDMPDIQPVNAILMELESFYDCIRHDRTPYVSLTDGLNALQLAYEIIRQDQ